ncbi:transporter, UIT1 family [Micromonospora rhizosphaerae]|uniref:Transporter, UIT1 family n=1 Tax=Micromonospora rhizosphaerae TaxID=568872 RepID=A0A1C6STP8_9ACTN|nr:SLC13 family permease [Micromonospora rhizosphaerae]SCL32712.1 transporter, UIT1 family [Micromonospora rhizosphaerae]
MSVELVSILVLALIFLIATVRPVNLGALAIVAAFIVGISVLDGADLGEKTDAVFAGFPGDLFVILVGVTYLFAIAKANGTVDWLVQTAVRLVGGRVGMIPWIMFLVTACLTAIGAVVPASVAIIAPIGMGFAKRYKINPLMMGLLIINGASAGGFSPISIFGSITNGVVEKAGLPGNPTLLFLASFFVNLAISVVAFFMWGGRDLVSRRAVDTGIGTFDEAELVGASGSARRPEPAADPGTEAASDSGISLADEGAASARQAGGAVAVSEGSAGSPVPAQATRSSGGGTSTTLPAEAEAPLRLDRDRIMTVVGLLGLAIAALFYDLNVGMVAVTVAAILTLLSPESARNAVNHVAWPTVLLVCGIVMYVGVMQEIGTIKWLGEEVATIGAPLMAALVICFIGGAVSAFASTTGILGALIPLAVPFLTGSNAVGAVGLITALALSSSIVDSSPYSTSGALTVANATEEQRDYVYKGLMRWGFSMVVIIPVVTWLIFVVPGWL